MTDFFFYKALISNEISGFDTVTTTDQKYIYNTCTRYNSYNGPYVYALSLKYSPDIYPEQNGSDPDNKYTVISLNGSGSYSTIGIHLIDIKYGFYYP